MKNLMVVLSDVVRAAALVGSMCLASVSAHATVIQFFDQTPDFSSPRAASGFPIDYGPVATFNVSSANAQTATIAGTWGNVAVSNSSAPADVFLDGILVASCRSGTPCDLNTGLLPWSYTFSRDELDTGFLDDGIAILQVVQLGPSFVRLGNLNLYGTSIIADSVPEPAALALLLLGLGGVGWRRKVVNQQV